MRILTRVPILLAGVCLLLTACGEQREILAPEFTTVAAVVSAAPDIPHGTYRMTLDAADFPPFFPPQFVSMLSGEWELDLNDPRQYRIRLNGVVMVEGVYQWNKNRVVWRDISGPLSCEEPRTAQGVYGWTLNDVALHLTAVKDHCDGRAFVLTVKPWQRQ